MQANINRSVYDSPPAPTSSRGLLRPVWAGNELLLARRVATGPRESIQACRVDWPAVRQWLLESVKDLLPDAKLVPLRTDVDAPSPDTRLLASLPVRLEPGPLPAAAEASASSPLRVSLLDRLGVRADCRRRRSGCCWRAWRR